MSDKRFTEQLEVAGNDLVAKVKELAKDADAKRVIIKDHNGSELMSFPLSWGVAGSAVAVMAAPALAAIAAVGGLAAKVTLEVERTGEPEVPQDDPPPASGFSDLPPPPPMH